MRQVVILTTLIASLLPSPYADAQGEEATAEEVIVVTATPLAEFANDLLSIPAAVQVIEPQWLRKGSGLETGSLLTSTLTGIHLSQPQGGSFQPDVLLRGFVASPLLGASQGISVYQDGVRINEPFGDTVNWDLLPPFAISRVEVVAGSAPMFGLNALGGAVAVRTVVGRNHTGHRIRAALGSHTARGINVQQGGTGTRADYFIGVEFHEDGGWRNASPSWLRRGFGKSSWQSNSSWGSLSLTGANNELRGNGAVPARLLASDRRAVLTYPDITSTGLLMPTLRLGHRASPALTGAATLYYRRSNISTFNADIAHFEPCANPIHAGFLCELDEVVIDQQGVSVGAGIPHDGVNNRSTTRQDGFGAALLGTLNHRIWKQGAQLLVGLSIDRAVSQFHSDVELATLTPQRTTIGSGVYSYYSRVGVQAHNHVMGFFASHSWTLTKKLGLMVAARYDRVLVQLDDLVASALDGEHTYGRFNPALGLTYRLYPDIALYAGYSESSRMPSPVELTCADPEDPCRLPNAFVADPPLDPVAARSVDLGIRSSGTTSWSASAFRTMTTDDLLFISSGAHTNQGYFANVGQTERHGLELSGRGRLSHLTSWFLGYTYLRARFSTGFTMPSPHHPVAQAGEIHVPSGSRIPGIPHHNLKFGVTIVLPAVIATADVITTSSQPLRGDEANFLNPVGGFAIANLGAAWQSSPSTRLMLNIENVLGEDYETFGMLGEPLELLGPDLSDTRFLSPGAPRTFRLAIEWSS